MFSVVSIFCYRLLLKSRNDKWAASLQKLIKIFGLSSKVQCCRGCWWFFWWRHQWNPEIKEILLGRYVCSRIGWQSKQLGRSKLGGTFEWIITNQVVCFMRKRGKFVFLLHWKYFSRSSNCTNQKGLVKDQFHEKILFCCHHFFFFIPWWWWWLLDHSSILFRFNYRWLPERLQ